VAESEASLSVTRSGANPLTEAGLSDDVLGVESFRRQILLAVVLLTILVSLVATVVSFRLGVHLAREREAWSVARQIDLSDPAYRPELTSELEPPPEERDSGSIFTRNLETGNVLMWGYTSGGHQAHAWAELWVHGQVVQRLVQPLSDLNSEVLAGAFLRALIGTGLLAWLAFWGGVNLTNRIARKLEASGRKLVQVATHDTLTGLPNRYEFEVRVGEAFSEGQRGWLMMMDLNNFKDVNDSLGHSWGDLVLKEVGKRVQQVLGDVGSVARFGGDEFAIYLPSATLEQALDTARRVSFSIEQPIQVGDSPLAVGASIGLCDCAAHAETVEEAVSRADMAMYAAKRVRGEPVVYTPDSDFNAGEQLTLRHDLQRAMSNGEVVLHYQPKKCLRTGLWVGVEALARWKHPRLGFIPPITFIEIAEKSGLIHRLTVYLLNYAADQAARFQRLGIDCPIAVNVSNISFSTADLLDTLTAPLTSRGLPMSAFEIELTESAAINDQGRAITLLRQISEFGLIISLDDFGTGMSSLSYLHKLPIDIVKIDRSFVMKMSDEQRSTDERVVEAIITLAHHLGRQVVAEGVEDELTEERLRELGCEYVQGYGIQRPVSGEQIEQLLLQHGRRRG
jgi:diguanylate cyclase (GGDEF)-like protein